MTKSTALEASVGGRIVRIGGMCKGSGMIHPNMATMLGVLTCDAAVTPELWRPMFKRAALASFNQARSTCFLCLTSFCVCSSAHVQVRGAGLLGWLLTLPGFFLYVQLWRFVAVRSPRQP